MSNVHWTPLEVCVRVAKLLNPSATDRVLDVGSGVGKLCIVGALLTEGEWTGVERREELVETARSIAEGVSATRAHFLHADAFSIDWRAYNVLYFFNPFGELDSFERNSEHEASTQRTQKKLEQMPKGTRVAIYFDMGTGLPPGYALTHSEELLDKQLTLWVKTG